VHLYNKNITKYLLFCLIFWGSWLASPFISSDSLHGVLDFKPNVVLEVKNGEFQYSRKAEASSQDKKTKGFFRENTLSPTLMFNNFPLLLSERHTAVSLWPYLLFQKIFPNGVLFVFWHFIISLAALIYFYKWADFPKHSITSWLPVVSPLVIWHYGIFVTEVLMSLLLFFTLYKMKNNKNPYFIGLLLGLGLLIRPNYLWCFPIFLIYEYNFITKKWIKLLPGIFASLLCYFLLIDTGQFVKEVSLYRNKILFEPLIAEILSLFTFDPLSIHHMVKVDFDVYYRNINFLKMSLASLPIFIIFSYSILKFKNTRTHLYAIFSFIVLLLLSIQAEQGYSNYLFPLSFFATLFWSQAEGSLNKYAKFILMACIGINIGLSYNEVLTKGPVHQHSYSLVKKVLDKLDSEKKVYTLGVADIGKYEYLSENKVYPIHLNRLILNKTILDFKTVLDLTKKGTLVIPKSDSWSAWPKLLGDVEDKLINNREILKEYKLSIESVIEKKNMVYIINYEKK
tara:strand:+ start:68399 stop:69931 length:1533 start_codon:yes stop_codon:yes gene_type:complete